jgi:hypothetical protein
MIKKLCKYQTGYQLGESYLPSQNKITKQQQQRKKRPRDILRMHLTRILTRPILSPLALYSSLLSKSLEKPIFFYFLNSIIIFVSKTNWAEEDG